MEGTRFRECGNSENVEAVFSFGIVSADVLPNFPVYLRIKTNKVERYAT